MASELVERLAKKRWGGSTRHHYSIHDETRWWLNAIADELDASEDRALEYIGQYEGDVFSGEVAARWLRTQAESEE